MCKGSLRVAVVVTFSILSGIAAAKTPRIRPLKAHVHFFATGACVRGTLGGNQDTYLAEIVPQSGADPVLARLIDEFLTYQSPISVEALTVPDGTILRIRRDTQCDLPYGQIPLRTAPGDPMAIVRAKLHYQPHLVRTPTQDEVLPCYRTVRP
jgi:hypothetical protein